MHDPIGSNVYHKYQTSQPYFSIVPVAKKKEED
ncbi:hypothetical protein HKBW3S47_02371, partial [Candidatus Hakubella thermalkaliphila]